MHVFSPVPMVLLGSCLRSLIIIVSHKASRSVCVCESSPQCICRFLACALQNLPLDVSYVTNSGPQMSSASLTGSEARLLLSLSEVGVGVEVGLQGGRSVDGLTPAFPLDQVGHPALSHGRRLRHMVLHYLGNACQQTEVSIRAAQKSEFN